jgi:hypothetical protein
MASKIRAIRQAVLSIQAEEELRMECERILAQ